MLIQLSFHEAALLFWYIKTCLHTRHLKVGRHGLETSLFTVFERLSEHATMTDGPSGLNVGHYRKDGGGQLH